MLKHIWLCAACLLGGPLVAETIGNVEFQFPPSNYEWKVFVDNTFFEGITLFDDDDEDFDAVPDDYTWGTPLDDYEDEDDDCGFEMPKFKMFTHREGDALEIFVAIQLTGVDFDDDDEDETSETREQMQKNLDENLNKYLPNHRFIIHAFTETDDQAFGEWEMSDGNIDVMHGYTRALKIKDTDGDERLTVLGYLTTSVRNENNRALWTNVLNQVRIVN